MDIAELEIRKQGEAGRPHTCFNCFHGNQVFSCPGRNFHPRDRLEMELKGCGDWLDGEFEAIQKEIPIPRQKGKDWREEVTARNRIARAKYNAGYRVAIPELPPKVEEREILDPLAFMKPGYKSGDEFGPRK